MRSAKLTPSEPKISGRKIGSVLLAMVMLLSSLALLQTSADATELQFAHDEVRRPGQSCPEGTRNLGATAPGALLFCRPDGFVPIASPIGTAAMCELAREAGAFGVWAEGDPVSVCWHGHYEDRQDRGCIPAAVQTTILNGDGEPTERCVFTALVRVVTSPAPVPAATPTADPTPAPKPKSPSWAEPICINDDALLGDDDAAELQVGSIFRDGGKDYVVTTGSWCGFDCVDGFDVNCDGKLGDYCASEFDRRTVAGAKACLASVTRELRDSESAT